jgi:hypothetical protein
VVVVHEVGRPQGLVSAPGRGADRPLRDGQPAGLALERLPLRRTPPGHGGSLPPPMTFSDWVAVGAALGGAIVGGLMALLGSVIVSRRELLRATRMRLLERLEGWRSGLTDEERQEAHRTAVLVGRREKRLLEEINRLSRVPFPSSEELSLPWGAWGEDHPPPSTPAETRYYEARERMAEQIDALERLLVRKLARLL